MQYHPMRTEISYQPRVTAPYVTQIAFDPDVQAVPVQIFCNDKGALIMFRTQGTPWFKEYSGETIFLHPGDTVETFTMKVGYNPSAFVYYTAS
jgi:hypothetical protein